MATAFPQIAFHGGKCCGIKVIHSLGYSPKDKTQELFRDKSRLDKYQDADQYGFNVNSEFNCFNRDAPAETSLERVKRYVNFLDEWRPNGIIEIVLADSRHEEYNQVLHWTDAIKELGFVEVTNCHNSNSSNRVYVYHRTRDIANKPEGED